MSFSEIGRCKMEKSIIDRDIEFYTGEVERLWDSYKKCKPSNEKEYVEKWLVVNKVLGALKEYKKFL
jgi:hypothetical protein